MLSTLGRHLQGATTATLRTSPEPDVATLPPPVPHPLTRYDHVYVTGWDCRLAVGDAAAAWAAARDGRRCLAHGDLGWGAPLPGPAETWLTEAVLAAAVAPWASIADLPGLPAWSVCTSKGDPMGLDPFRQRPDLLVPSFPGALGGHLARHLGLGVHLSCPVVAACSTGLYALLAVADAIAQGRASRGLAGAADGALPPWLRAGFANLGVLAEAAPPDSTVAGGAASTGFAPVPGAGLVALADRPGPWRLVAGVRLGDARHETHFSDPATLATALAALWEALPAPDLIVTHATGTAAGDRYEKAGLDLGPWRAAPRLACKPVWGHALGASGAVELAAALEAPVQRLWKLSLGFGGHLAAVALERA